MGWKGVETPVLTLSLLCMICFTVTLQQDPCSTGTNQIEISFPESELNSQLTDAVYSQVLLASSQELNSVTVGNDKDTPPQYPFQNYFEVRYVAGNYRLIMLKGIDRDGPTSATEDDVNILQYQVACQTDPGSATLFKILKVLITDVNDNTPQFSNLSYAVEVNELTPIGVTVYRAISAADKDEGPNSQIVYILSDATTTQFKNGTQYFSLPSDQEGIINVKGFLDFESMYNVTRDASKTFYIINVIARDNPANASLRRSSMATLTIKILDGDDLGPEFVYDSCILSYEQVYPFCIRPKYTTTLLSGTNQDVELIFWPVPAVPNNADNISIIMQDRDTLNSPIACIIKNTEPAGYTDYFTATAIQIGGSKQYRCRIVKKAGSVLTRSVVSSLELIIVAIEQSFNRREEYAIVSVQITPTNLYPPTITPSSGVGYIYENSPVLTLVSDSISITNAFKLTFQDPDVTGTDPPTTYTYSTTGGPFTVGPDGYVRLTTNNALDYEQTKAYTLTVVITEQTAEKFAATATVSVNVLNVNDVAPSVLSTDSYIIQVPQGNYTTVTRDLVTVTAIDQDGPALTYSLKRVSPAASAAKFNVLSNGLVKLQGAVTAGEVYTVYVNVSDGGTPLLSAEAAVVVTVLPLANQAPAFTALSYTIYVSEGLLNNSRLFDLPVSDPDTPLNQLLFTSTELTADRYVYISGLSLLNLKQFDREVIPQHTVTVRVADPQGNTATATVIIIVQDINDNSPTFGQSQYTFSIQENQPVATIVGSVSATDADEPNTPNSALTYGIVQTLDFDKFTINPSSGQLASNAIFDYETKQQYQIVVRVSDNGNAPRTTVVPVTVNILDLQDNPPLFQVLNTEVSVNENVANFLVATLKADDADSVKSYNFVLADNAGSTDSSAFSVQTVNNEARIYVNTALNYEVKNRYTFQVTTPGVTGNILYTTASVTVNVLDTNDNTPVIGQYIATVTVLETVAIGSTLSNFTATDADGTSPNNRIEYKVQSVSPNSGSYLFYVGEKSAILTVASSLQADRTVNTYTVTVIAFDLGTPSLTATGTVTVTIKRNRAPYFTTGSTTLPAVNEKAAISTSITRITTTDPDTNITPEFAGVTYSLAADSVASSLFQINPNTGDITLTGSLSNRAEFQYTIQIIATDLGGLSARATLIIPVNRNLFDPQFDQLSYTTTINENFPLGDTIVQIAANDNDINSPWKDLSFTITGDALGLQYCAVSDTGIIFLRRTLALTNITELNLVVSLKDKGTPPRTAATTATVKITVIKNSQSPIFFNETYRVTIPENQAVSSPIITVSATDADTVFNKLTYYVEGDQSAAANFAIDPNTGVITLIQDLKQSSLSSFVIRVAALDDGTYPRRGTALVFVDVTRNLQSPSWIAGSPTTATVYENAASGTSVVKVSATDTDSQAPNNVIDYIITSGGEYFQVDQSTGLISVKVPVYLDTATSYQVTLIARDRGTPTRQSAPFTVTITPQRNRFAPKWQASPYNFYLTLPLTNNQLLRTLTATDDDLPPFNQLTFELLPYSSSSLLFTSEVSNQNQNSINIRVPNANLINFDTLLQYFFYAKVRDSGSPSLSDIALVTFYVNRNLNVPSFLTTTKDITINETLTPGSFVIDCPATDADGTATNNGVVTYSDGSSFTTSNYFRVVGTSSGIILQRPLQQDTATTYTVIIRAQDNGNPPLSALNTCTVTIRVIRNQNPPVFVNTLYDTTIARTATAGFKVVQVTATDADLQAPFNVVRYEIVRQSVPNIFDINSVTGDITLATGMASQADALYTIAVRAYDGGNPALSAYNVFRVTVNGNLQSPVFVVPGSAANYIASVEILEHIGFNYDIYTVNATDGDNGDAGKVSYYLVGDNQALMYYQVITDSGIIRIRSSLLQDNVQQYTLNIIARDGDISNPKVSTTTATVSVSVYRNKFSPQFINMAAYNQVIDANLQVGQRVTAVTATDADRVNTYERVDYQIIGDGDSFGLFQINSNTGEITLKSSLANYGASVYYVRVQANDNGVVPHKFSNTTVLTIMVNQNLHTPVWNVPDLNNPAFTYTISEDQYLYFPFGFLSATDGDSQPPHNLVDFYYSPASQSALEFFRVTRDGEMSAIKSLVGTTTNSYTWTMGLSDRGTPIRNNSRLATVTVFITRNNNAPYFTNCPPATTTVVREDAAVGTTVLRVTASDNDPPSSRFGNITVSWIGDGTSNVFFRLNSNNEIVVDGNLASTSTSSYQILVQVSDQGSPPKQAQCVIPVSINHNLQAPVFGNTSYSVRILENLPPASSVIRVTATDADIFAPNNVIDYIITSGGEYFQVDQSTGVISVKVPVYLDTATSYQVTLIARDRGTPTRQSAPFTVTITPQRNRFAPKWQATPYNFYLTLPLTNNQLLRTLTATDDDLPPFNKLEFDLLPYSNTQPLFTAEINNQNSVNIRVPNAKLINFDTLPQYFFYARVHDNGTPRLSDIAVVILNVHQNSNDSSFPTTTKTDTADEDSTLSLGGKIDII